MAAAPGVLDIGGDTQAGAPADGQGGVVMEHGRQHGHIGIRVMKLPMAAISREKRYFRKPMILGKTLPRALCRLC